MPPVNRGRPASLVALLVTALVTGAFVGFVAASFIWLIEEGTAFVWGELPEAIGVDPFESWWIIAVPIVGGLLVGAGQIVLGNYPRPLEEAIASWKEGGHIEPQVAPKTAVNSLFALLAGGPVGFEAALVGVIGGTGTWVCERITSVGGLVRQAWGAERIEGVSDTVRHLPYWLAATSGPTS
jgi:H+/Cl- antiporter ClcA